jgi:hypothetical protein
MTYRLPVGLGRPARKTYTVCCLCALTPECRLCGQGRHTASCHLHLCGRRARAFPTVGHTGSHAWGESALYARTATDTCKAARGTRNPTCFSRRSVKLIRRDPLWLQPSPAAAQTWRIVSIGSHGHAGRANTGAGDARGRGGRLWQCALLFPTCAGVAGALIVGRPARPGSSPAPANGGAGDSWREAKGGRGRHPSACLSPRLGYCLMGDPPAVLCASDIFFRDCQVDNST